MNGKKSMNGRISVVGIYGCSTFFMFKNSNTKMLGVEAGLILSNLHFTKIFLGTE